MFNHFKSIILAILAVLSPAVSQDSVNTPESPELFDLTNSISNTMVKTYDLNYSKAAQFLRSDEDEIVVWKEKDSLNQRLLQDGMANREARKNMIWIGPLAGAGCLGLSFLVLHFGDCKDGDPAINDDECNTGWNILAGLGLGIAGTSFIFKSVSSVFLPSKQEAILKNKWDMDHDTRQLSQHYEFGGCIGLWKGTGGMDKFGLQILRGYYLGIGHLPWSFQTEILLHLGKSKSEYSIWNGINKIKTNEFKGGMVTANMEYFPVIRKRIALGYGIGIGYQGWSTMDARLDDSLVQKGLEPEAGVGGMSYYFSQEFIFWNSEWVNARISSRLGYPFISSKAKEDLDGPNLSVYLKMGFSIKDRRGL